MQGAHCASCNNSLPVFFGALSAPCIDSLLIRDERFREMSIVACIQMASGPNIGANLLEAERLIEEAVSQQARLLVLPENFALMGNTEHDKVKHREVAGSGPIQTFLAEQAARHGIWLVGGTVPLVASDENKIRATCLVFNDKGEQAARYDKIHLFDVQLIDSDEQYTSVMTCVSRSYSGSSWKRVWKYWCCHPPSRLSRDVPTGRCWCGHGPSKTSVM